MLCLSEFDLDNFGSYMVTLGKETVEMYDQIFYTIMFRYCHISSCVNVISMHLQTSNYIVTFLPFKPVYYLSSLIANQSKNKYVV